jgi:hypothetical protein
MWSHLVGWTSFFSDVSHAVRDPKGLANVEIDSESSRAEAVELGESGSSHQSEPSTRIYEVPSLISAAGSLLSILHNCRQKLFHVEIGG